MPALRQDIDPNGLLEYSVVYTDRALNHMSKAFQQVMNDLSSDLKSVYNADAVVIVPGSGTYGMEAVARQLANDEDCLIIRNGWFSYLLPCLRPIVQMIASRQNHLHQSILTPPYPRLKKKSQPLYLHRTLRHRLV